MKLSKSTLAGLIAGLSIAFAGPSAMADGHTASKDIVETAASAGSFNTLLAAAEAAGLVEALKGEGPLTVFAPTDEAFAALGEQKIQELLQPANREQLKAILLYHVVPSAVYSGDATDGARLDTLEGSAVQIGVGAGTVTVDEATVVQADVKASNGVIHVIDRVILPAS